MSTLVNLFFRKKWASVRNVFRKPLSAILTLAVIALFGFMLAPMLNTADKDPMTSQIQTICVLLTLGFALFLIVTLFLQKNRALFFLQDSYYIFTGPFTRKQVLAYLLFDVTLSGMLLGALSLMLVFVVTVSFAGGLPLLLVLFFAMLLVHYIATAVMDYIYVKDMIAGRRSKAMLITILALLGCIGAAYLYSLFAAGFNASAALDGFINGPALYFVPVLGWAKLALDSGFAGNLPGMAAGYGLLVGGCVAVSLLLVNIKGDFYEQAMLDAENFTEYYQKAKEGRVEAKLKKKTVHQSFAAGEMAVFSKNLLMARKTTLVRPYDILVVGAYVLAGALMDSGILYITFMLVLYQFADASSSSLVQDLQSPYIYLIPGNPLKKLLASMAVPVVKSMIICTLALAIGGVFMSDGAVLIAAAILLSCSFSLLVAVGNVVALRLMRSRNNAMVEQTIRMFVVLAGLVPSAGVLLLLLNLASLPLAALLCIVAALNVVMALLGLWACSPMMNGKEISSD